MSRFESLEFDDQPKTGAASGAAGAVTGTPIRDAAYFKRAGDHDFLAGRPESALQNYSKALERDNALFAGWLGQVVALLELDEYREADLWAGKALERFPEHPELLAARAVAACRMGLLDKALAYSDNALSGKGATPYVWIARGEVFLQRRSRTADHCFSQGLALCEGRQARGLVHFELARLLRRYGRFSRGLDHASEAVQALPRFSMAWMELGDCQAALGLKDAGRSFEHALELDPRSAAARDALNRFAGRGFGARLGGFFRRLFGR